MFSSAVYSFLGFPGWGPVHLVVPHQGSPAGTAMRLERASRRAQEAGFPAAALLSELLRDEHRADPLVAPQACHQADYRYLVVHRQGARWPLRITAWRCCGDPPAWQRRWGPMELERFIARFQLQRRPADATARGGEQVQTLSC
ncbi:hypothetical protein [Cyanobium sp. Morenito 9A2]|uniref:hypothetical protein n=1 Tax=Cyanobium sp. Morenito 9A2 TaxID=2823718 RepID=UPI0020CFC510|nr:hypothetical protein [Cyanobium sp. Morenito 9A2]MCP9848753.1 hypothetical protein [Cyanobium sp. Morenito 9A2]